MNESFIAGGRIILTLIDFVACGEICMQKMQKLDSFGGREQQDFYNRSSWTSLHLLLFPKLFRGGETPLHPDAWQEREVAWKACLGGTRQNERVENRSRRGRVVTEAAGLYTSSLSISPSQS